MSRVLDLVQLYRLSLQVPEQEHVERFRSWLRERQAVLDRIVRSDRGAEPTSIERALCALIDEADNQTRDQLLRWRRRMAIQLRRQRTCGSAY